LGSISWFGRQRHTPRRARATRAPNVSRLARGVNERGTTSCVNSSISVKIPEYFLIREYFLLPAEHVKDTNFERVLAAGDDVREESRLERALRAFSPVSGAEDVCARAANARNSNAHRPAPPTITACLWLSST
jgi:hypothetical protein